MHEQMELAEKYHQLTEIATQHNAILQPTFGSLTNVTKSLICTPNITLKTYQFKTHCKGTVIALKPEISFCQDS